LAEEAVLSSEYWSYLVRPIILLFKISKEILFFHHTLLLRAAVLSNVIMLMK